MATLQEKIRALEEEIKATPYNKASEAHIGLLKAKLARLKEEFQQQRKKGPGRAAAAGYKKVGDATVVIFGDEAGATGLLNRLTGATGRVGVMLHRGAQIQIIAPNQEELAGALPMADLILSTSEGHLEAARLQELIRRTKSAGKVLALKAKHVTPERIFSELGLIRAFMKKPGKAPDMERPLILKQGSTVRDVCATLHKKFLRDFYFARVWGASAKFPAQRVGLEHKLADQDVLELNFKR